MKIIIITLLSAFISASSAFVNNATQSGVKVDGFNYLTPMASVRDLNTGAFICGAYLVTRKHLITTVRYYDTYYTLYQATYVRLGTTETDAYVAPHIIANVSYLRHSYGPGFKPSLIGFITLKFAVNESPTIQVAPLPKRPNPVNVIAQFIGWGPFRSVMSGKPVQLNKSIKKMAVSLHTKKVCDKYNPAAEEFFDLYCMSARWDNEHFFKNDVGGVVIHDNVVIGVLTSFVAAKGKVHSVGYFMSLYPFVETIEEYKAAAAKAPASPVSKKRKIIQAIAPLNPFKLKRQRVQSVY